MIFVLWEILDWWVEYVYGMGRV